MLDIGRHLPPLWLVTLAACGGGAAAPAHGPPVNVTPGAPGDVTIESGDKIGGDGTLELRVVADTLTAHLDAARGCYRRELDRDAYLHGRVIVEFTVGASGTVTGLVARGDGVGDPAVASCAADVIRDLRFPAPSGGEVRFRFPFVFEP